MIFRNIFFSALFVGVISGLVYSVFQQAQLSPIIYAAEKFEMQEAEIKPKPKIKHDDENSQMNHQHDDTIWAPKDGSERLVWTIVANVLTGISFALVMLSLMAVHNLKSHKPKVDALQGIGWGAVGVLTIFVAPALVGLHPEVPGTIAVALENRQAWWLFAVIATIVGVAVLYYAPLKIKGLGVIIAISPQLAALPITKSLVFENTNPIAVASLNELSHQFFSLTAIGTTLFFIILGVASGYAMKKFIKIESALSYGTK